MIRPRTPENEVDRLGALAQYDLIDTAEESTYDSFAALARQIAGTSIGLVTLVDEGRQWFKSHLGLDVRETPRDISFCGHVVADGRTLVVPDTYEDDRFKDNPLVTGEPHIRFYAGIPLTTPEGYTVGTLCVLDPAPNFLDEHQMSALAELGRVLVNVLESRRRFLTLFDAANIDVFTIDPADACVVFASRGACRRLGYDRRELIGMPAYDIMPNVDLDAVRDIVQRVRSGEEVVREAQLVRRDGTAYPVELRVDMTSDDGRERVLAIATDLTQRKLQQREIDLLLGAINAAGDVILVYEVSPEGDLCLSYMNDAYTIQSGYSREEALGRTLEAFRQAMPDDEGMRSVRSAIAAGTAAQEEIVSYRKDGTTYWNQVTLHPIRNVSGVVTHWIAIERDISEEVERTSTLAEEHDRLLSLTRAARRIFSALDARALVVEAVDVIHQLLNVTARVLAVRADGMSVAVAEMGIADWSAARPDPLVERALASRSRIVDERNEQAVAYTGLFGDAAYALEMTATPPRPLRATDLFVFDLIAEYFAVAARNVTLYHELEERRSAVLELNQTKSDLIAMLAHDFRGPLTSIVGFADLVGEVGELSDEQCEFLETIKRSALQLSELATDTLTLSRLERNELTLALETVDLEPLLRGIVAQCADRRRVALHVEGDLHVVGDTERLRQVFGNLIDNAIKYSPDGSEPDIRVRGEPANVVVSVIDRGIGIPSGELSRVFDRFSRASNARQLHIGGTGFGLFLTKQLVQLHGGTIAVESEEGRGSMFRVTLPRRVDRRAAPRTAIILDRQRDGSFLQYGLQEAGYRVRSASSLEDVLAFADTQPVDVLLLNVDGSLPRTDAVKFRTFGRERNIPIVAIAPESMPRLAPAIVLQPPVLIADVIAALDRLFSDARV